MGDNSRRGFQVVAWCLLALGLGLPAPVLAQQGLDEVVVTSRKREERLQEIPLSVTVFTPETMRERNIQTVYDVATFTPNFSFNRNAVGRRLDAPSIRGQFTPLANFGTEGNVAFYVDGAYVSGTASSITADNIERVEILKGPQAAQFGRGAFAGAINYITRAPNADKLEGGMYLKAGEESDFKTSGFLTGPLIGDKLLFFASASWESFDGEWQNSLHPCQAGESEETDGCDRIVRPNATWPVGQPASTVKDDFTPLGGESTWNVTGKLSFRPLENLTFNVKADYTEADDEHFASLFLDCTRPDEPCEGEIKPDGLRAIMNIADLREGATSNLGTAAPAPFIGTQTTSQRFLAEGLLDLGGWDLKAIATMNKQELESYRDLDRSPALGPLWINLFDSGEIQTWDDYSGEVRATSPQDQPIRGSAGVYYFSADNLAFQREFTGFCNRVEYGLPNINGQPSWTLKAEKENLGFFGGLDYDVGEDVTLAVEGRYAKDSPVQHAANGITAQRNFYSFTPRVTAKWQATEDVNLYALVAKGNKPGGFYFGYFDAPVTVAGTQAALANGKALIKEENAWTYEMGAKTQWLDRRLTANIAIYYIDWKNQAINEIDDIPWECADTLTSSTVQNNVIKNAGESQVMGTEVELTLAATDNLTLELNYGLQDTELLDYVTPNGGDVSGNEAPRVPKHTITASAAYRRPLGDRGAEWFARGDYVYNSKTWLDAENDSYVGALNLLNARIGIDARSWTAAVYLDNVLADDTPLLATYFPNFAQFPTTTDAVHIVPRRGRNAGLTLTLRF